ncbi:uncharacterized protein EV420DRAFT_1487026 [Desarmillaria tabescens]|uniref:Uncharacterized protein n=1 Tax=Armillaria tabescens TaxID=1929756 RepID=A0AA39ML98_ARMTA|nr:uncharacterized protein EV420DRAFT_1487026 [Desarmillaria tabescens]KAK0437600.1 hypothetical protein EV420DRAFT_1487026 [Desarmillaria tabescens]
MKRALVTFSNNFLTFSVYIGPDLYSIPGLTVDFNVPQTTTLGLTLYVLVPRDDVLGIFWLHRVVDVVRPSIEGTVIFKAVYTTRRGKNTGVTTREVVEQECLKKVVVGGKDASLFALPGLDGWADPDPGSGSESRQFWPPEALTKLCPAKIRKSVLKYATFGAQRKYCREESEIQIGTDIGSDVMAMASAPAQNMLTSGQSSTTFGPKRVCNVRGEKAQSPN